MKKSFLRTLVFFGSCVALQSQASLMLETYGSGATPTTIGGYEMTDFNYFEPGSLTSTVDSPLTGQLNFEDRYGNALSMTETDSDSLWWWNNNEGSNYNAYTTDQSWLKIILPENTLAFSFSVGAKFNSGSGWLTAQDSNGFGLSNVTRADGREYFSLNNGYSPSFGVYADNSQSTAGNCSYVSEVVIDPDYWGAGNFSISQGECSTNVPEPSMIALMGLGIAGLGFIRRKQLVK